MANTALGGSEVTFGVDRYKKPQLLSEKESVIQILLDALLMIPGNLPNLPNYGVNVMQYLLVPDDEISSEKILRDLETTCGTQLINITISKVDVSTEILSDGRPTLLIVVHVINTDGEEDAISIVLQKVNDIVKFNYSFLNETVNNAI